MKRLMMSSIMNIHKANKSPGEDSIIWEFSLLFWEDIGNDFFQVHVLCYSFNKFHLSEYQYREYLT